MESDHEDMWAVVPPKLVMCSTCAGFVLLKKPNEEGVVEVLTKADKMRDLMRAVELHGPLQEIEPADAKKRQWKVLRRRRMIMMETKRCPACSRPLLHTCPTCSHSLVEKPGPDEEDKAMVSDARSKEKKSPRSERKKIATDDEAMVADAGSENKLKRSMEAESSGLKNKKKKRRMEEAAAAKSKDKEDSGSKMANGSSETKGSGSKETKMEDCGSEEAKMEDIESVGGKRKTKMVTRRLGKESIDKLKNYTDDDVDGDASPWIESVFESITAKYEVDCEFREYLRRQFIVRGYAEFQEEVDDEYE